MLPFPWPWLVVIAALLLSLFSQFQRRHIVEVEAKIAALQLVPIRNLPSETGCILSYRYTLNFDYPIGTARGVEASYSVESKTCDIDGADDKRVGDTEAVYIDPAFPGVDQGPNTVAVFAGFFALIGALSLTLQALLSAWRKRRRS